MNVGVSDCQYRHVPDWVAAEISDQIGIVAADSRGRVYVVDREPNFVVRVFETDGSYVTTWGGDFLRHPHSIWIDDDDLAFIADVGLHTVEIYRLDRTVVLTLGTRGQPGAPGSPFNQPTWAIRVPWGELYVSNGYGHQRVHRFDADGVLIRSWGSPGNGPGEFDLPHCVKVDPRGRLLVINRGNAQVQILTREGDFAEEWTDVAAANDLVVDDAGVVHLAEATRAIALLDLDGRVIGRWDEQGSGVGQFVDARHRIWRDQHGDVYVCEVPASRGRLQKFVRIGGADVR